MLPSHPYTTFTLWSSLCAWLAGLALFFEVIRPFRDLEADGPLAIACWAMGFMLALQLWVGKHRRAPAAVLLLLHGLCLLACFGLFVLMPPIRLF